MTLPVVGIESHDKWLKGLGEIRGRSSTNKIAYLSFGYIADLFGSVVSGSSSKPTGPLGFRAVILSSWKSCGRAKRVDVLLILG